MAGYSSPITTVPGADKSLARPGRKLARKHVRDARDFNNIVTRVITKFFFLHEKVQKEIHAILTETLASFLPGRAKDLSARLYTANSASFRAFWCVLLCRRASRYRRFEDRVALVFRVTQSKKSAAWTRQWRHYGPSAGPATRCHYIPEILCLLYAVNRCTFIWSNVHSRDTTNRCLMYCTWTEVTWPDMVDTHTGANRTWS